MQIISMSVYKEYLLILKDVFQVKQNAAISWHNQYCQRNSQEYESGTWYNNMQETINPPAVGIIGNLNLREYIRN